MTNIQNIILQLESIDTDSIYSDAKEITAAQHAAILELAKAIGKAQASAFIVKLELTHRAVA